ncbi:MAG: 50S ribosomal protein L15 [Actinobacteria bacterium RBG_13_63_9]|nr:MAG: 50S ribosomal protein L15 [Actinobacteria bacterium RBG_13_63_9]
MGDIFLHNLEPDRGARRDKKRVGRGEGSGVGKTSGRGHKGSKQRSGGQISPRYEGGQMPLHMRLPKLRGPLAKTAMPIGPFRPHTTPVNLSRLAGFGKGEVVSPDALLEKGIIKKAGERVKILGNGELTQALTIKAHGFSASAKAKIEAAGGTAEVLA